MKKAISFLTCLALFLSVSIALISYNALSTKVKGQSSTLSESLKAATSSNPTDSNSDATKTPSAPESNSDPIIGDWTLTHVIFSEIHAVTPVSELSVVGSISFSENNCIYRHNSTTMTLTWKFTEQEGSYRYYNATASDGTFLFTFLINQEGELICSPTFNDDIGFVYNKY